MREDSWAEEGQGNFCCEVITLESTNANNFFDVLSVSGTCVSEYMCVSMPVCVTCPCDLSKLLRVCVTLQASPVFSQCRCTG